MITKLFTMVISVFLSPLPATQTNTNVEMLESKVTPIVFEQTVENQTIKENQIIEDESDKEVFDENTYNINDDIFNVANTKDNSDYGLIIDLDTEPENIDAISSTLDENEKQAAETQLALIFSELGL